MDKFNGFYTTRKLKEVSYSPPDSGGMVHFGIDEEGKGFVSLWGTGYDHIKVEIPVWLAQAIFKAVEEVGKVEDRN